jgi:hypothetical protein
LLHHLCTPPLYNSPSFRFCFLGGSAVVVSSASASFDVSVSFIGCSFTNNRSPSTAGAVSASFASSGTLLLPVLRFSNCQFVKNSANLGGGAVSLTDLGIGNNHLLSSTK